MVPLLDLVVALDKGCSISVVCGSRATCAARLAAVGTRLVHDHAYTSQYQPAMRIAEVGAGTCVAELGSQVQIPSAAFPA